MCARIKEGEQTSFENDIVGIEDDESYEGYEDKRLRASSGEDVSEYGWFHEDRRKKDGDDDDGDKKRMEKDKEIFSQGGCLVGVCRRIFDDGKDRCHEKEWNKNGGGIFGEEAEAEKDAGKKDIFFVGMAQRSEIRKERGGTERPKESIRIDYLGNADEDRGERHEEDAPERGFSRRYFLYDPENIEEEKRVGNKDRQAKGEKNMSCPSSVASDGEILGS